MFSMFSMFSKGRFQKSKKSKKAKTSSVTLRLEQLERRDCPATTLNPFSNVNVSAMNDNQAESTIAVDPGNDQKVFAASVTFNGAAAGTAVTVPGINPFQVPINAGIFAATSNASGANGTWVTRVLATGGPVPGGVDAATRTEDSLPAAFGDPQTVFDQSGNLYLVYMTAATLQAGVATSVTANTLTDTSRSWFAGVGNNEWAGKTLTVNPGQANQQTAIITSNTADTITINGIFRNNIGATPTYTITQTPQGAGTVNSVIMVYSTDYGAHFKYWTSLDTGVGVDFPAVATGPGRPANAGEQSIWASWFGSNGMVDAIGAPVTAAGAIGNFLAPMQVTGSNGMTYPRMQVGPRGQVIINFQTSAAGVASDIYVNTDPGGLGGAFNANAVLVATSNIGYKFVIPAQPTRGIFPDASMGWDRTGNFGSAVAATRQANGRVYMVFTDFNANANVTQIWYTYSDDLGLTWHARALVSSTTTNSQFMPAISIDQTTGAIGIIYLNAANGSSTAVTLMGTASSGADDASGNFAAPVVISQAAANGQTTSSTNQANATGYAARAMVGLTGAGSTATSVVITNQTGIPANYWRGKYVQIGGPAGQSRFIWASAGNTLDLTNPPTNPNFNAPLAPIPGAGVRYQIISPYGFDYGEYIGLVFQAGWFYPIWSQNNDPRGDNPNGQNNALDLYTAWVHVTYPADGGPEEEVSVTSPGDQTNVVGAAATLPITATDTAGDPLVYAATGLPDGLSIDPDTGVISGTISGSTGLPYVVTVTATDDTLDISASTTFDWSVVPPVTIVGPGDQTNTVSDSVSVQATGQDADGNALQFSASGLPAGLGIDPNSGIISGTIAGNADANGPYTVTVTATDSIVGSSATETFTWEVNAATPTVSVSDSGGIYNSNPFAATATVTDIYGNTGASLEGVTPIIQYFDDNDNLLSGAPTQAGTYTAEATFAGVTGSTDYSSADSDPITFTIGQATPTVAVSDGGTYNGNPFPATATVTDVNGNTAASLEGVTPTIVYFDSNNNQLSGAPTTAGIYTATATFAGSTDYTGASQSVTFTIGQATPTVAVSDGGTYNSNPFAATATVTDVNGNTAASLEGVTPTIVYFDSNGNQLGGAPTLAGTYTATATFAGSTDYTSASQSASFTIGQATPTVAVSDAGGTYSGNPFPATATVTDVNGNTAASLEGVTPTIAYYDSNDNQLSGAPTLAGTYTATATFAGSTDYTSASQSVTFTIGQATPTVSVSDGGGTYNGNPFPATATVTDVNGNTAASLEGVTPTIAYYDSNDNQLSGAPTLAGTYTATAMFSGSTDYTSASQSVTFTIGQATPTVSVSDAGGTYNGNPFPATATVTDVNGNTAASLEGVTPTIAYFDSNNNQLSGAPTTAGTYTAIATFAGATGSTDYSSAVSTPVTFTISQATPTVAISDAGGTYSGNPFPATETVTDVNGNTAASLEGVTPTISYYDSNDNQLSGAPTTAGTYTAVATFPGSTDYTSASQSVSFTIGQATPTVAVSDAGGSYNSDPFPATETVTDVNGNTAASLEGVTPTISYYDSNDNQLSAAPTQAGAYTAVATFPGSTDYTSASQSVTFTIGQATPTVAVSDAGGSYNSDPFPATATVTDVNGNTAASLEGVTSTISYYDSNDNQLSAAPTQAGAYTAVATFPGSTDYTSASQSVTFTIGQATPTVAVSDAGGSYNSDPFPATATVTDVNGNTAASLEGVTPTISYYDSNDNQLSAAPTQAGAYTAVATFPGSTDYTSASQSVTFTIGQATPTVAVSDAGGSYNSDPFPATATVTDVNGNTAASLEGVTPTIQYFDSNNNQLSGAPTTAGAYTAVATFPGSTDYTSASQSVTFTISQATPTVAVSDAGGSYNSDPFPATATVTDVNGNTAASLEGVTPTIQYFDSNNNQLSGAPTTAGAYTAVATFPGSTDYTSASQSVTFTISQATPTVAVSDAGGSYNSDPFPATETVTDVNGNTAASLEGVTPTLAYFDNNGSQLGAAPTQAGAYSVVATFPGSNDYTSASQSVSFTIGQATPSVSVSVSSGTYTGSPFTATATVTDVNGNTAGSLEGVTPTVTYYAGSDTTGTPLSSAPSGVGTYTVVASFAGSADYTSPVSSPVTFTISQATTSISLESSLNPAVVGDTITFSVNVVSLVGAPTGTVTFYDGTTVIGTATIDANGNASIDVSTLAVGSHAITAAYSGDDNFAGAVSDTLTQVVLESGTVK